MLLWHALMSVVEGRRPTNLNIGRRSQNRRQFPRAIADGFAYSRLRIAKPARGSGKAACSYDRDRNGQFMESIHRRRFAVGNGATSFSDGYPKRKRNSERFAARRVIQV
jgi:hypothetical protein